MDECPHCGEPIEEDAESCQHCGSDFETGWKADTYYYTQESLDEDLESFELPEERAAASWETFAGYSLVFLAFAVFIAAGASKYQTASMPFGIGLLVCFVIFTRMTSPKKRSHA